MFRTGKARFVQHVEVAGGGIGARVILATGEEALESCGVDSGLAELPCGLGSWGKSFDDVSVRFRALPDGLQGRGFAGSGESLKAVDTVG